MFATSKDTKSKDSMMNEGGSAVDASAEAGRHFRSEARDTVSAVKSDFEGVAHRTGQHVRDLADSASHGLSDAGSTMTVKIRENPVQSSIIALGVGFLMGVLFKR